MRTFEPGQLCILDSEEVGVERAGYDMPRESGRVSKRGPAVFLNKLLVIVATATAPVNDKDWVNWSFVMTPELRFTWLPNLWLVKA